MITDWLDPVSYKLGQAAGGGGGGGNPNYVETITGTLANPWGDIDILDLGQKVMNNNATVFLEINDASHSVTPLQGLFIVDDVNVSAMFSFSMFFDESFSAISVVFLGGNFLNSVSIDGTAGSYTVDQIPSTTPTTLTIIHHPLP